MVGNLFEGLANEDAKGNPVPGAASSWENNKDFTQYTFHLRDGAVWSNGDPVKASDFVYSWQRAVDPKTESDYLNKVGGQIALFTTDSDAPKTSRAVYIGSSNVLAGE